MTTREMLKRARTRMARERIRREDPKRQEPVDGAALAAIVLMCLIAASVWLVRVPFFAEPDENAHADYALTIWSAGRLIRAAEHPVDFNVSPYQRALADAGGMDQVRFNPSGRAPAGYGTPAYIRAVDRRAAAIDPKWYAHATAIPYLVPVYPFGFYGAEAAVFGVAHGALGSLVFGFFAMRMFCLLLLAVALVASFGIARECGLSGNRSLALVATVGLFPTVDLTYSYVQPDDLAGAIFIAGTLLALRVRNAGATLARTIGLGAMLALEAAVKPHIGAALAVATLPVLGFALARAPRVRAAAYAAIAVIPAVLALLYARGFEHGGSSKYTYDGFTSAFFGRPVLVIIQRALVDGTATVRDLYSFNSLTFDTFWHALSTTATRITLGSRLADQVLDAILQILTLAVLIVVAARLLRNVRRLAVIARKRSPWTALRLASRNVTLNSYFSYVGILVAAEVYLQSALFVEGRYLMIVAPATAMIFARDFPLSLPRKVRAPAGLFASGTMLAYSVVLAVAAFGTIQSRWYGPPNAFVETHEYTFEIDPQNGQRGDESREIARGQTYVLSGWVIDSHQSRPAPVRATLDGHPIAVQNGIARTQAVGDFADGRVLHSGFSIRVDTRALKPGTHHVALIAIESGRDAPDSGGPIPFDVVGTH